MQSLPIAVSNQDIKKVSLLLKVMGHPLRLKILCFLSMGKRHVQEIITFVGSSQSNVSQHLFRLREQDVVSVSREANRIYYRISDDRLLLLLQHMHKIFCSDVKGD